MEGIKITSFKRISREQQVKETKSFTLDRDPTNLNVLLYTQTQNETINEFQQWIRKEHKQKVYYMKLIQQKSIIHAIKSVVDKKHRKTFIVTTKSLTQDIENLIKANESIQLASLMKEVKFIILVDSVQEIEPKNFWISNICLITCQISDVQNFIENQLSKIKVQTFQQVSSICSEDQAAFEEQFAKNCSPLALPKFSPNKNQNDSEVVINDNPGVGSYQTSSPQGFKGSKSGTFMKGKR